MLPVQTIATPRWLPDIFDPDNTGLRVVQNAIPHATGFVSANSLVESTGALTGTPLGAIWGRDSSGNAYSIVGTPTGLYFLESNLWKSHEPETITGVNNWSFVQFGGRIVAVAAGRSVYAADLDDITTDTPPTKYFSALSGSPPKSNRAGVVRDFLVLGDILNFPARVQWSGLNNAITWTPDAISQSGRQDLPSRGGSVQQIVSGEYGLIFQETSIHRMTYQGGSVLFQFDEVERNRGTQAPNSVCWTGDRVFYYSPTGFYQIIGRDRAGSSEPIGVNQVDRWVERNVLSTTNMRGVVDPTNKLVLWSIQLNTLDHYDAILMYRWDIGAWGLLNVDHSLLATSVSPGADLDSDALRDFYGGSSAEGDGGSIDNPAIQTSFDSPRWRSGGLMLHGFSTDNKRGEFSGPPLDALFETGFRPMFPDRSRFFINSVRPGVDRRHTPASTGSADVTVITKDNINRSNIESVVRSEVGKNGRADIRASGRFYALRGTVQGGFEGFSGFEVYARPKGMR